MKNTLHLSDPLPQLWTVPMEKNNLNSVSQFIWVLRCSSKYQISKYPSAQDSPCGKKCLVFMWISMFVLHCNYITTKNVILKRFASFCLPLFLVNVFFQFQFQFKPPRALLTLVAGGAGAFGVVKKLCTTATTSKGKPAKLLTLNNVGRRLLQCALKLIPIIKSFCKGADVARSC